jgi:hypothetical protein
MIVSEIKKKYIYHKYNKKKYILEKIIFFLSPVPPPWNIYV